MYYVCAKNTEETDWVPVHASVSPCLLLKDFNSIVILHLKL